MAVSLNKGGRVDLTKGTNLKKAVLGLGWDIKRYAGGAEFDLDLVIFECNSAGKCLNEEHMIFYNNLEDPEKAIKHSGDNRTGAGDGDDESATVDFTKINAGVSQLIVAVTIYDAKKRDQNFGQVDNAYIRLVNAETGEEILRYDLSEDFSTQISVVFAVIYKSGSEWKFRAVGDGFVKELADFCREYGLEVA